jgi:hypothetical protein
MKATLLPTLRQSSAQGAALSLQIKWGTSRLERLTMLGKRPVRVTLFLLRLVRTLSGRHNGSGDAHFPRSAISSQVMVSPAACFDPLEALEKGPLEKSTCFASRGYDVGMEKWRGDASRVNFGAAAKGRRPPGRSNGNTWRASTWQRRSREICHKGGRCL